MDVLLITLISFRILDELNAQNAGSNDSLELGDSWRAMPRRTEGVVNKTNGLYRRSALPAQPMVCSINPIVFCIEMINVSWFSERLQLHHQAAAGRCQKNHNRFGSNGRRSTVTRASKIGDTKRTTDYTGI